MRSLWFKLMGVFLVVIVIMLGLIVPLVNTVAARQFDLYVTRNGQTWAEQIAPRIADQYGQTASWTDAKTLLSSSAVLPEPMTCQAMDTPGSMSCSMSNGDIWQVMGYRLVLTDTTGIVVADTAGLLRSERVSEQVLSQGTPVISNGERIGTLLVVSPHQHDTAAQTFIQSVARGVWIAALLAGTVAVVAGTILFRRVTNPLQRLQRATQTVAQGQLNVRVPTSGSDELRTVAHSFNHMAARLDEQQRLRKQMLADVAHELRTPIAVMQGTLEAMIDGLLSPDSNELEDLHGETRRLARLVEDLRTLSLADAGQLKLEHAPVDLIALTREVASRMGPLAGARGISFDVEAPEEVPAIRGDEGRLAQVLANLLDNALRYTPSDGQIAVRLRPSQDSVTVEVSDSGPGIPSESLPYIFDRFWRADKSRSRESGGSGIGLAIVRQLVELHGGAVAVESEVGRGSVFRVTLPVP